MSDEYSYKNDGDHANIFLPGNFVRLTAIQRLNSLLSLTQLRQIKYDKTQFLAIPYSEHIVVVVSMSNR